MSSSRSTLVAFLCLFTFASYCQQAKFGKGISLLAADSSLYIKMGFRFQSLFVSQGDLVTGGDWNHSFAVRRSRFKLDGWAVNPNFVYKVELALSNQDLKSSADFYQTSQAPKIILDAVLKWKFHKNFTLWAGQTKLPGNRERVVSSQNLQFVDRSLVNSIFTLDRDMGVHLHGKFGSKSVIKPILAISLGEGRNVTTGIGGFSYTGRLEYLPFGEFASKGDYFGSDLKREPKPKLAIGVTYNVNNGASRQKQAGRFLLSEDNNFLVNDLQTIFVDAVLKYNGWSITGEFADKRCILDQGVLHEDVMEDMLDANGQSYYTGRGLTLAVGYLFPSNWELATRFTTVEPDWEHSFQGTNEYTLGISRYIVGHSLKIQGDVSLIDKVTKDFDSLRYRVQFEFAL